MIKGLILAAITIKLAELSTQAKRLIDKDRVIGIQPNQECFWMIRLGCGKTRVNVKIAGASNPLHATKKMQVVMTLR
jgi:hypothetical protein